jgi:hypothetical protein
MTQLGRERGRPPMTRDQFDALTGLHGALVVGSPEQVAEKIPVQHEVFGHQRFLVQSSLGAAPHRQVLRSIELLGTGLRGAGDGRSHEAAQRQAKETQPQAGRAASQFSNSVATMRSSCTPAAAGDARKRIGAPMIAGSSS